MTPEEIQTKFDELGDEEQVIVMIGNYLGQAYRMGKLTTTHERFLDWQMSTTKMIGAIVATQTLRSLLNKGKRTGRSLESLVEINLLHLVSHIEPVLVRNELLCQAIFDDFGGKNANRGDEG
jgi:hypothetical protein